MEAIIKVNFSQTKSMEKVIFLFIQANMYG